MNSVPIRWFSGNGDAVALSIAMLSFAAFTVPLLADDGGAGPRWAVALLGAAAVLPLLAAHRRPVAALVAVCAVLVAAALAGVRFTPFVSNAGPALGVAAGAVALLCTRRASVAAVAAVAAVLVAATLTALRLQPTQAQDAVQPIIAAVGWLVGDSVRGRHAQRAEVARQREARVRVEERLRLSRDVHDVVSHTLSMIAVRSGVARLVADRDPREAAKALGAIETASRQALTELRRILRDTRDAADTVPHEPALADLAVLAHNARSAGLDVQLVIDDGDVHPLLQTTIYRIAQESLTNVVKHAQARHVDVRVAIGASETSVTVCDDGVGRAADAVDGIGTASMRERAALHAGTITAGAGENGGGHRVIVSFPRDPADA